MIEPVVDRWLSAYARWPDHPMKLRILNSLLRLRGTRPIRARLEHGTFDLDLADYIQGRMFFDGVFEPATMALIRSLLQPGHCFIDVGANIGQFAIAAGSLLRGSGVVVAIEPHPAICAELLRNRALNELESTVIIVPAAISDRRKLAAFGIPSESNRGSSREVPEACTDRVHVFTSTLRAVCEQLQLKVIDVMKIDVEGAELSVLRSLFDGGADLRPRHIVCEYVRDAFDYRDERGDLMGCLTDEGYVIRSVDGMPYSPNEPFLEYNIWASLDRGRDGARCY